MAVRSAGIVLYRRVDSAAQILLVHPGGPFWAAKDEGAWSIPKGLCEGNEEPRAAARREFKEETGFDVEGPFVELGAFRQPSGKIVLAWAAEGDCDPAKLRSNRFAMEWPPRSGRQQEFPEVDRAGWFGPEDALHKIVKGQRPVIAALLNHLSIGIPKDPARLESQGPSPRRRAGGARRSRPASR
jgi:predicted NUDIX family NTP pyrophosphohydrolase